jgi:hypothetical protein
MVQPPKPELMTSADFMLMMFKWHIDYCHTDSPQIACDEPDSCAGPIFMADFPDWKNVTLEQAQEWHKLRSDTDGSD